MKEDKLKVFIAGAQHYFSQIDKEEIIIGTPYLVENKMPAAHDYTGIIAISGNNTGIVYFTAPRILLAHILESIQEPDLSEENMTDLVGEVANTIAGNSRSEFGEEFNISVPIVICGAPDEILLPRKDRSFVIPLEWRKHHAAIVICLRK
ncbi:MULTISPECIES: chemotaxis protein CheX [Vitreoscilla]|uniref:Chemotaxis protein CheX n=1 Tax=Vitreoscilla stercoraria TaxID=61 RepID=A0ABY4EA65_VITST|nr:MULTISPECIES: chemotaxis protein CheX [Vitreoscilla]AUZ06421.1 chemotaxis phosphatase CheX [Vitreoscilla sp. C1]UOO92294.1 chemotaxis protein CheX [Vitreoscilla stercoraria]